MTAPVFFHLLRRLSAAVVAIGIASLAHGQTYWLNSQYDTAGIHYPTAEEACITGELQRRLDIRQGTSPLPHRYTSVNIGPDYDIGERVCQAVIQRRQFNLWITAEIVATTVYGPLGEAPDCPLDGTEDPDTGQCLVPKCDSDCPLDGGNPSNPVASASGNKRQRETDFTGAGIFPLTFTRTYSSARIAGNHIVPLGAGWTHNYAARLVPIPDNAGQITQIRAHRPNGAIQTFTLVNGQWQGDADVPERLAVTLSNGGLLQAATYRRRDDSVETYNQHGRLTYIKNSDGHEQTLQYAQGDAQPHTITDPQGRTLQLAYNSTGQLSSLTASDGSVITYSYDSAGNLASATYPGANTRQYHYGEADHPGSISHPQLLTGITDENSQRTAAWAYDAQRRAILSVHGAHDAATDDRTTFAYNTDGSALITDSLGQSRHYQFSVSHRAARLATLDVPCDTCANTAAAKTYDANGYPASSTDFDGNTTHYTFDANGRQTQKTQAAGTPQQRRIETGWLPDKNKATQQRTYDAANTLLLQTTYTRNSRGQPLTITHTDPQTNQSRTTSNTYCEATSNACPFIGLLKTSTDPAGNVTAYSYYAVNSTDWRKGDLHQITNAASHTTTYQRYDGAGRPLRVQDANGLVTDYQYSARGWLTGITHSDTNASTQRSTTIAHTPSGQIQTITRPDGSTLHYSYDNIERLIQIADNQGNTIQYTLDSAGHRIQEQIHDQIGALRHSLARSHNLLGRVQTTIDANNTSTHHQYSAGGLQIQTIDALGRITQYGHDPLQRLKETIQDANGIAAKTTHQYNALNQHTQTTDPKNLATKYQTNTLGDLLQQSSPDSGITKYTYNSAGHKISETNANGHTAHYSYDEVNRITAISHAGAPHLNVTYQYDSAPAICTAGENFHTGRLAHMHDASGTTSWCYNRFGDLTRKVQNTEGTLLALQYQYYANGQLHTIQYPDGTIIDHVYDSLGRISEIGSTQIPHPRQIVVTNVEYVPFGEPIQWQYGNGRVLARTLDENYRPHTIHDSASGGLNLHYMHDAAGNITALHTASNLPLAQFGCDGLNRIATHTNGSGIPQHGYKWDKTGNRVGYEDADGTRTYDYESNSHRLKGIPGPGGAERQYDPAGNTIAIGTETAFIYGADNRLESVQRNGYTTWYQYNGHGERVSRKSETDGSITRSMYLEDGRWLGDYDYQAGQPLQQIIWLYHHPVAVLNHASAEPLHYIESDHLGTPRVVIEQDRNLAVWHWPITGEAFGNTPPNENPDGDGANFTLDMRFPGQRYDSASGLYYNYFRDYEPETGRYTQSDPIGLEGGLATYGYVEGNPLVSVDPDGLRFFGPRGPGGNSRNRRQWRRHGPKQFEVPDGEGSKSAWEAAAEMITPNADDYRFRCLRWECNENLCTQGNSPTDFLPPAYYLDDAPDGCKCTETYLGPVFHPPQFNWITESPEIYEKHRRSEGVFNRLRRSLR